jgi:hypothetical protein
MRCCRKIGQRTPRPFVAARFRCARSKSNARRACRGEFRAESIDGIPHAPSANRVAVDGRFQYRRTTQKSK